MAKLCSENCENETSKFLKSSERPSLAKCGCEQPYHIQCLIGIIVCQSYSVEDFSCENEQCEAEEVVNWTVEDWKNMFKTMAKDKKLVFMWHVEEDDEEL